MHQDQKSGETEIDYAFLNVNLGKDQASLPIAAVLRSSNMPFSFVTGYSKIAGALLEGFVDVAILAKPFDEDRIDHILRGL